MYWSVDEIATAVAAGLQRRARADDAEQAVYGFDHLAELGLHPLIQQALREAGFGVYPERRYPAAWSRSRRSEGQRCDLVLTPDAKPLRDETAAGTLFDTPDSVDPEEAYWLEIKTVAQFESAGPFRRYAAELLNPVAKDVLKLWGEGRLRHAGLLLVLFTADRTIAEHDVRAWHQRCLERNRPVLAPATRGFSITDRIGNGWCEVAVFGVRGD